MKWQIPYDGHNWEFDSLRLTASEARLQKRLTDGMTPIAADNARNELDPDAWVAGLAIARKRAGLPVDVATSIDDDLLDLAGIQDATNAALTEQQRAATTSDVEADGEAVEGTASAEPEVEDAPAA